MRRSSAGATVLLLSTCLPGHAVVPVPCFALLHVVFKWVSPVYVAVDSIVKWISARLIPLADFGLSFTMAHIFPLTQLPMCQPSSPAACVPTFLSCRWGLQLQFARSSMLDAVLMICDKERRRCSWRQPRATLLWSRCGSLRSNCRLRLVCSSYAPVCSRMLPCAPVCSRVLWCTLVCSFLCLLNEKPGLLPAGLSVTFPLSCAAPLSIAGVAAAWSGPTTRLQGVWSVPTAPGHQTRPVPAPAFNHGRKCVYRQSYSIRYPTRYRLTTPTFLFIRTATSSRLACG